VEGQGLGRVWRGEKGVANRGRNGSEKARGEEKGGGGVEGGRRSRGREKDGQEGKKGKRERGSGGKGEGREKKLKGRGEWLRRLQRVWSGG